jgi:hypothetical protein
VALRAKQVQDFCVFIGPRPVGAKHSGNNLSVKLEIFYPNASPVLFAANPKYVLAYQRVRFALISILLWQRYQSFVFYFLNSQPNI